MPKTETNVITLLVITRLHSRHIKLTVNQITPPTISTTGPIGYSSGKALFIKLPTISVAVAIHFK